MYLYHPTTTNVSDKDVRRTTSLMLVFVRISMGTEFKNDMCTDASPLASRYPLIFLLVERAVSLANLTVSLRLINTNNIVIL